MPRNTIEGGHGSDHNEYDPEELAAQITREKEEVKKEKVKTERIAELKKTVTEELTVIKELMDKEGDHGLCPRFGNYKDSGEYDYDSRIVDYKSNITVVDTLTKLKEKYHVVAIAGGREYADLFEEGVEKIFDGWL